MVSVTDVKRSIRKKGGRTNHTTEWLQKLGDAWIRANHAAGAPPVSLKRVNGKLPVEVAAEDVGCSVGSMGSTMFNYKEMLPHDFWRQAWLSDAERERPRRKTAGDAPPPRRSLESRVAELESHQRGNVLWRLICAIARAARSLRPQSPITRKPPS